MNIKRLLIVVLVLGCGAAGALLIPRVEGQGEDTLALRVGRLEQRLVRVEERLARLESHVPVQPGAAEPLAPDSQIIGERVFQKDGVTVQLDAAGREWRGVVVTGVVRTTGASRRVTIILAANDRNGRRIERRSVSVLATQEPQDFRVLFRVGGIHRVRVEDVR